MHQIFKKMGPLFIIPFYKNPGLVAQISESLIGAKEEITELDSEVVFVNDSPDDAELERTLQYWSSRLAQVGIKIQSRKNNTNLGFIKSCNKYLAQSSSQRRHALLLNSDTYVFPGFLREMLAVLELDPMIGFVCPRSNNATICTFPHGAELMNIPPAEAHDLYKARAHQLPPYSYVPTGVGFCILIKWQIIENFGLLDVAYGKGYCEENDLIFRAGRCGYRVVLANRAFVWHQGEQSFLCSEHTKTIAEKTNNRLLNSRYPEYQAHLDRYYSSPEYEYEKLISELPVGDSCGLDVVFDFSNFGAYHNGTFEAGKRVLSSVIQSAPGHARFFVLMNAAAHSFHEIDKIEYIKRIDASEEKTAAVWVRFGQYFDWNSIQRAVKSSPVLVNFFLDTIAHDCSKLSTGFDPKIWSMMSMYHDIIFTNSEFTKNQLLARFPASSQVEVTTCLHSTSPSEYLNHVNGASPLSVPPIPGSILIVGNHFSHKSVEATTRCLERYIDPQRINVFGLAEIPGSNAHFTPSGSLTDEQAFLIYKKSELIVFPSHYEGFGFPLMNAIAAGRPIIVREQPVYREILDQISPKPHVYFYETESELEGIIESIDFSKLSIQTYTSQNTWAKSGETFWKVLNEKLQNIDKNHIKDRLVVYGSLPGRVLPQPKPPKHGLIMRAIVNFRRANRKRVAARRLKRKSDSTQA